MNGKFVEMVVHLPASQYVRVEGEARERSSSVENTASFLLSKWVLSTPKRNNRAMSTGKDRAK